VSFEHPHSPLPEGRFRVFAQVSGRNYCKSRANPIECHFGPLRDFVVNNSDYRSHAVLTRRLHAYLRWRNTHAADPALRERVRRERARLRAQRQRRWARPPRAVAALAA
jgi:hypothetical protein